MRFVWLSLVALFLAASTLVVTTPAEAQRAVKMCVPLPLPGAAPPPPCPWSKGNPGGNCHCGAFNGKINMVMVPGPGGAPPPPGAYVPPPPPPPPGGLPPGLVRVCVPFPPAWGKKGEPPCPWNRGTMGQDCHCGPYPGKVGALRPDQLPEQYQGGGYGGGGGYGSGGYYPPQQRW